MRIHPVSDIHLEFGKLKYTPPECNVVICAGDISPGVAGIIWARKTYGNTPIVYVAGNHEFYGGRHLHNHYEKMKQKADELGVRFLQNESVIIDNTRFIGCTLWTDFNLWGDQPLAMIRASQNMNDYRQIYYGNNKFITPQIILNEFKISFDFLQNELANPFDGKTVVVTHHAPSELSCLPKYQGDNLNCSYASQLDKFIEIMQPDLWVHGHIHDIKNYLVGVTKVVANPRGYVGMEENGFNSRLIIEI